ncbi:MAG: hypothetical protein PF689_03830 [Deltaproteobacteria bacterium]|jgi:hypothetical protein|nr:hypothetical protein [Deltaproteobacteria bacterium]
MLQSIKANLKFLLLFLWDPEKTIRLKKGTAIPRVLLSSFTLFTLLFVAAALYRADIAHLTCWTPAFHSWQKMFFLLGGYFILVSVSSRFPESRTIILLSGSITLSLLAAPAMTIMALAFIFLYFIVVRTSLPNLLKHLWVVFLHLAAMAGFSFKLMPQIVFDSTWSPAGLMFSFFIPLRLFWYHYQLTREHFDRLTFKELFLYFFVVPAPIMIPYMFALPRRSNFAKIEKPEKRIQARGTLYIAAGLTFYLAYHLLKQLFLGLSSLPGLTFLLFPWGYPLEPVFWALGSAYMITGMYNRLGAEVTLAFRSPLNSPSVLEWWRRWNVHFRDMLVDMFFYPFVMGRRKKHPYLRIWAGVFGVFIIGSTLFHLVVKHYFMKSALVPYWSIMVENTVMFLAVGMLLHLEKYRLVKKRAQRKIARKQGIKLPRNRKSKPLVFRILSYPLTYTIVFFSVIGGYISTFIIEGTYIDRPTAVYHYSLKLKKKGKIKKSDFYYKQARKGFTHKVENADNFDFPFNLPERHAALKLLLIYYESGKLNKIPRLVHKLDWEQHINIKEQGKNRYLGVKNRALWELTRLRGISGLKTFFSLDF